MQAEFDFPEGALGSLHSSRRHERPRGRAKVHRIAEGSVRARKAWVSAEPGDELPATIPPDALSEGVSLE